MSVRRLLNVYHSLAVEGMDDPARKKWEAELVAPLDPSSDEAKLEERARRARENAAAAGLLRAQLAGVRR